jgi:hypothetical protein
MTQVVLVFSQVKKKYVCSCFYEFYTCANYA